MKLKELRALSAEELTSKLADTREELMKLRFQAISGQLTDTSRLPMVRKDIARMKTVLNERLVAAAKEGEK